MRTVKRKRTARPVGTAHLDRRTSAVFVPPDLAASLLAFLRSRAIVAEADRTGCELGSILDLSHDADLDIVAELLDEWAARRQWWTP